jgi:DNA-directed RNA polymerase subunit beta'
VISVKEANKVNAGAIVAKWVPHTHPIVTEMKGTVTYVRMEEGITIKRQTDELTGLTNIEVLDAKERPAAGKHGNTLHQELHLLLETPVCFAADSEYF